MVTTELGDELDSVRDELTGVAGEFMPDLCHIIEVEHTPDGFGGTTETDVEVETFYVTSYIPVKIQARATPMRKELGGGQVVSLTHDLTLPSLAATQAISMGQKIVVAEGNGHGEMVFRNPVVISGSFSAFVKLAAEL